jgi:autotransporter-associated beta strand protein
VGTAGSLGAGPVTIPGAGILLLATGINFNNFVDAQSPGPGSGEGVLMVNDTTNGAITTISGPLEFDASPATGGDFVGPTTSGYLNVTGPVTNTATGLISDRSGLVRFSGGGNYTAFDLTGTTSIGANNGLCPSAALNVGVSGSGTFDLNGFNQTLTGLIDGATPLNTELVTNSAASPATLTLNLTAADTYSGVIAGNLALVENGSVGLYLAGTNAYTGNTTVNGGTLELAEPSLAAGSTVTVASGAVLQLDFSATNKIAGLVLNGASQPSGLYNAATSPSYLTGSGGLLVTASVIVPTTPTNIVASLSGDNLKLSWPANYIGWRLLVQTNNLAQGLSTNADNWGTVSGSTVTNQINLLVDPAKPAEFYRLVYP